MFCHNMISATCLQKDLTNKLSHAHKENTAPNQVARVRKGKQRDGGSNNGATNTTTLSNGDKNRMSVSDVSEMLYELYMAKAAAKEPKFQDPEQQPQLQPQPQLLAVEATETAVKYVSQILPTSTQTSESSSITAPIAIGATDAGATYAAGSENGIMTSKLPASFHARTKSTDFTDKLPPPFNNNNECNITKMTAIPTSVVVPTTSASIEPLDIKPIVHPTTGLIVARNPSVIQPVPVSNAATNPHAALAAALIRDGYHSFQQQIRAQELIKFHSNKINTNLKVEDTSATKILENFLRQHRNSECDTDSGSDNNNDGDDEDDSRYNAFEDIHLVEGASKSQFPHLLQNVLAKTSSPTTSTSNEYYSDESQKYMTIAAQAQARAQALINLDFQFGGLTKTNTKGRRRSANANDGEVESIFECRHCNKKYRWKSTLRRHENVECGGKAPSHQCPYCPYKSKQRGNLGVHVRKHHANKPQLASKRRSKYSTKFVSNSTVKNESTGSNTNNSDDSNSKLIIDCSK